MTRYWISCKLFTASVTVDAAGRIVEAAPIVKRFLGQPIGNLFAWARQQGGMTIKRWINTGQSG
jgi:hypothetical protein